MNHFSLFFSESTRNLRYFPYATGAALQWEGRREAIKRVVRIHDHSLQVIVTAGVIGTPRCDMPTRGAVVNCRYAERSYGGTIPQKIADPTPCHSPSEVPVGTLLVLSADADRLLTADC